MRQTRQGFTLIMGIWILTAMSLIMSVMLSYSSQTLNQTVAIYNKEQAQMLSKSATEYALLAISAHDRSLVGDCINHINATYSPDNVTLFDINTTIRYIGLGALVGGNGCDDLPGAQFISTAESNGTIIIDTYVTSRSANAAIRTADPIIRYHRRTLQKP